MNFTMAEYIENGTYVIFYEGQEFLGGDCGGTYHTIAARILGFSYPNYLRFCRDNFNAEIRGKIGYPTPFWKNKKSCEDLLKLLNKNYKVFLEYYNSTSLGNRKEKTGTYITERNVRIQCQSN